MARREQESGVLEEVIAIRFHTKVTKGGRKLSVAALVAVGDGSGKVGLGYGKAGGVPQAIEKANKDARASMVKVHLVGDTIAQEAVGRHGAARVLLIPASPGTGVKAGGTVRAILQVLGVHNVLSKVIGATNPVNVAKATMKALERMQSVAQVERLRGVKLHMFHPQFGDQQAPPKPAAAAAPAATAVAEAPVAEPEEPQAQEAAAAPEQQTEQSQ
jgi:small subunit ribosomal protein S5